ncbi:ArsR/SmtB family transcription factor [Dermabacteraceae bacterium P13101]|nr:metalloregulator ArsR/SmtB family transcription factor [Dermabacteraceae bacterium TAE3-ERU5]
MSGTEEILAGYEDVARLFGALSNPIRAAIVHRISEGHCTVSEFVDLLGLSQPLVSQHLKVLREAEIVVAERRGRSMHYHLVDEHVAHVFLDAYAHTKEEKE